MNITTRRHPRTLQAAFGPYTSHQIAEPAPHSRVANIIYTVVCFASLAVVGVLLAIRG